MKDLRPISSCSVIYKTVAKVLANRLKLILPYLISPPQFSFISERSIINIIIGAFEIIHYMKRKEDGKKGCGLEN